MTFIVIFVVVVPKGSMKAKHSAYESADIAKKILSEHNYSSEKIEKIVHAIRNTAIPRV